MHLDRARHWRGLYSCSKATHARWSAFWACVIVWVVIMHPGCAQVLPAGEKVRIVEVGSGSGGTSVVVMAALADLGQRIEFVYTDISPQLVAYGRKTYGRQYPFAIFRLLDVERDIEPQVMTACPQHFLIASLHAHALQCL